MKVLLILLGVLCICFILVCIISAIENRKLTVTQYRISSNKIPKSFHGCRIVVLADLHNASFGKENEKLLQIIREQQPDYIILAGDMIVGKPGQSTAVPVQLIRKLAEEYPVFYGKGNHELRVGLFPETYGDLWENYLKEIDGYVTWLINDRVKLTRNDEYIWLYGLDIGNRFYKRFRQYPMQPDYLQKVLGPSEKEKFQILIAHNPNYFPKYAEWGADLTLSGHLHGGMVRLPWLGGVVSPMFHFFPKYDKGRYECKDKVMLLSGGLGNHTFKFRMNNLPEILVITLEHTEQEIK